MRKDETIGKKQGEGIRALVRVRCGNIEDDNKYWLGGEKRICVICKEDKDNWEHFVEECKSNKGMVRGVGEEIRRKKYAEFGVRN